MARDFEAGARDKPGRRNSVSPSGGQGELDPNRSSMRRLSARRNTVRVSITRLSNAPEPVSGPRNKRLPRRAPERARGPSLWKRLRTWLMSAARATYRAVVQVSRKLSARLDEQARGEAFTEDGERSEKPASPALVRWLWFFGIVAMVGSGYALSRFVQHHLTTAPAFAIDAIEIKGLSRLSREELLHSAGVELGMNVFAKSPDDIHARLLRHPWILSADVRRELPSRLQITVRERDALAMLVIEACAPQVSRGEDEPACEEPSSLYLVSGDAKMIKRVGGKEPVDLPVITGITRERLASDAELSHRVAAQAVSLMQEYRNSDLSRRDPIGEIHLEANDGFSLYVGDDLTYVRLGVPPFAQKLSRMKQVFERLEREHARAEYVYLDNEQRPDRVAVRLR